MTSFKGYLFVAVPRAVGVHKVKEVAVVLPTQLLHLVLRQISQGGKELFLHLDRILVWLEVPLYKKKEEKRRKKKDSGEGYPRERAKSTHRSLLFEDKAGSYHPCE